MAINPRKIKKKVTPRPAKDLRSTDPKDLRNKALREANRAANENKPKASKPTPAKDLRSTDPKDLRNKALREANRIASERAKSAKLPTPKVSAGSQLAKGVLKKVPVVGTAIGFIADASPAGEGSTVPGQAQKAVEKRFKREIRQGTKLAVTGVKVGSYKNYGEKIGPKKSSGFGKRVPEGAKFERLRASRAALGGAKTSASSSGNTSKVGGPGGARAYENVSDKKSSTSSTAAAASSSTTGKTTGKSTTVVKERVGLQSRYQRDALAMETRNKSGNKAKKSILSLFRKG